MLILRRIYLQTRVCRFWPVSRSYTAIWASSRPFTVTATSPLWLLTATTEHLSAIAWIISETACTFQDSWSRKDFLSLYVVTDSKPWGRQLKLYFDLQGNKFIQVRASIWMSDCIIQRSDFGHDNTDINFTRTESSLMRILSMHCVSDWEQARLPPHPQAEPWYAWR